MKEKSESIFDEIPSQLSKHEKKFTISSLGKGARFRDYERIPLASGFNDDKCVFQFD